MPDVRMAIGRMDVANVQTAPEFRVSSEKDGILGDLRISRGGAYWRPKNGGKFLFARWDELDAFFKKSGEARSVGEYNYAPPPPVSFDDF